MERYPLLSNGKRLEIEVYYSKGGMNYFNGRVEKRGIYASFTQVEVEDGWKKYSPMCSCNYKILIKEMKRNSSKKLMEIAEKVGEHKKELVELYEEKNPAKIAELLKGLV